MTPAHQAALNIARDSFDMLRESVANLPDEALLWSPAEGMNPLAVLVAHSLVATRFLFGLGCGNPRDFQAYRANERAVAFVTGAKTSQELLADIDTAFGELERLSAAGTEADLLRESTTSVTAPGLQFLMHGLAHLREHVGHAQALHDLWLAGFATR
jgi:hypothetical protein